jgi:hypothetical protein
MGPRSRDLWGRTQGSRWGWCDGLPRRPARRTCWRVWNWRFAERGVTGWSRATGARSASRARWGRSTQPQAGNPGKRLAARHEQLIRAPGSAVSRLLCKRPRRLIFRAGYTGCTRAEGGALRRRNPSADSAAGIRRGRAQLDPGWSFYIFSSGGSLNHAWLYDLEAPRGEDLRLLRHFFSEQGDQIQAGRPSRAAPPLGQFGIGASTRGAESPYLSQ